jgi:hypothetical protein
MLWKTISHDSTTAQQNDAALVNPDLGVVAIAAIIDGLLYAKVRAFH